MSTAAELRKEQLKAELAVLETEEQQKKTLTAELIEAETAANEARRLSQINKQKLAEALAGLEELSREAGLIPQGLSAMRTKMDLRKQQAHQAVNELTVERDKLESEFNKKKFALNKIVEQIAEHPAYKAAREKQRFLVTEATTLAKSVFSASLNEVPAVLKKIEILADAENQLLGNARGALRDAGLPDIKPLLTRFVQRVVPRQLMDAIPGARTEVFDAVKHVTEQVSRPVLQ